LSAELPLEFSVFNYHSGLCFLSQAARDSLRGRAVIDGGAYWGDSALVFEKYHPSSIHSFEPMTIRLLERTVRERNLSNVIPINMGLGDEDGGEIDCYYHAQFADAMGMDASASVIDKHNGHYDTQKIHITTIDTYALKNRLDVGLIKLDVEGVELDVIRGALETIRSSKPVLLISIYHMPRDLFEIKPLIESLGLNYHFMIRHLSIQLDNEYMLIGYPS
jgi:FkbM family methyltransferase